MRYYKLLIDGQVLCSQTLDNPTGLNIQFNIQTYNEGQSAISEITVYNPPLWMFGEYMNLYNKKVELYAGVSSTPLTKIIGLAPAKQDLIAVGFVSALFPQWNSADMQLTIVLSQSPTYANNPDGTVNPDLPPGGYQFRVKGGETAFDVVKEALESVAPGVPLADLSSGFQIPIPCQTLVYSSAAVATLVATWGLVLLCSAEGYILKPRESSAYGQSITLKRQDFLCQPSPLGVSSMAITTYLRGDIRLGDQVIMPDDIFVGITNLSGVITDSSGLDAYLNQTSRNLFTMFSGNWGVKKIWHVGDLRNNDPQSWATHCEVVKL